MIKSARLSAACLKLLHVADEATHSQQAEKLIGEFITRMGRASIAGEACLLVIANECCSTCTVEGEVSEQGCQLSLLHIEHDDLHVSACMARRRSGPGFRGVSPCEPPGIAAVLQVLPAPGQGGQMSIKVFNGHNDSCGQDTCGPRTSSTALSQDKPVMNNLCTC